MEIHGAAQSNASSEVPSASSSELERLRWELDTMRQLKNAAVQARDAALLERDAARAEADAAMAMLEGIKEDINTPEVLDFAKGVVDEATHQRHRWGDAHDRHKTDADWFWLVGYLAGKALSTAEHDHEKRLHRLVATAAALANWHHYSLLRRPAPAATTEGGACESSQR